MADFVKIVDTHERITWVNRELVTDVTYNKINDKTTIGFCGDAQNYTEIPGGDFSQILFGRADNG